jgi:hypothetical protein
LTTERVYSNDWPSSLIERRVLETILKAGRGVASCGQELVTAGPPPLVRAGWKERSKTRAQERAAGTKKTALFDIVNRE